MKSVPNLPLTHRLPRPTVSLAVVTLTRRPPLVCISRVQPQPQYGQIVAVVWNSHSRPWRARAFSLRAPTGQTLMQRPQNSQVVSCRGLSKAVEMCAPKPRLDTLIAWSCWISLQA